MTHAPTPPTAITLYHGVVRSFNSERKYGFIWSNDLNAQIFYHLDNRRHDPAHPSNLTRLPVRGDKIVFQVVPSTPNVCAKPWHFADEDTARPKPQPAAQPAPRPVLRPAPRPLTVGAPPITEAERAFFLSQWMAQRVRFEVELDWIRDMGTAQRADCTCPIHLVKLKHPGTRSSLIAIYKIPHDVHWCDLHHHEALPHILEFYLYDLQTMSDPQQVQFTAVYLGEPPWCRPKPDHSRDNR